MDDIVACIINDVPTGRKEKASIVLGDKLVGVRAGTMGVASRLGGQGLPPSADVINCTSIPEMLGWLRPEPGEPLLQRSLALAAVNAVVEPQAGAEKAKGQEIILRHGRGKHVAVVGHFPFVERMGESFASFSVLELHPRVGDLPAEAAAEVLPRADVVAITGTAIINGTLAGLLNQCRRDSFIMVLGPSTPPCAGLFELGIDALAGACVVDSDMACEGVLKGVPFKKLDGVQSFVMTK